MTSRPTFALLIPAYNAASHLPRLLESAAAQTEPFDEIWVYDDCSTDDTAAVADRLGARVVTGGSNQGCTYGKSVLVQQTKADWVHFFDSDDLLLPHFVESARRWFDKPDVDVVAFGSEERWDDTRELIHAGHHDDTALAADAVESNILQPISTGCAVYRRSSFLAAGGFDLDSSVHYNEDHALHCKLARAGVRFRADATIGLVKLKRPNSMSMANQDKAITSQYFVMRKAAFASGGDRHRYAIAKRLWAIAAGAAAHQDWRTADDAALLALDLSGLGSLPPKSVFRVLCGVSPRFALRTREYLIRILKPRLRRGFPGWRAPLDFFRS
ncbi:MAG: glycosyltransferase family 2 protein [bacterium]|nr:glycosyltransferase family 2 protein [bacterium]